MRKDPNGRGLSRKAILAEIDASLRRLGHRLRRPVPDPPLGLRDADRGDARGAARRREGGEGPLPRRLVDVRLAVLQGALPGRPPRLDAVRLDAEPLQPALPRGGAGDAGALCRPKGSACSPGARWPAAGWPGRGTRGRAPSGRRPTSSARPSTPGPRRPTGRSSTASARWPPRGACRGAGRAGLAAPQARRHVADHRRDEAASPGGRGRPRCPCKLSPEEIARLEEPYVPHPVARVLVTGLIRVARRGPIPDESSRRLWNALIARDHVRLVALCGLIAAPGNLGRRGRRADRALRQGPRLGGPQQPLDRSRPARSGRTSATARTHHAGGERRARWAASSPPRPSRPITPGGFAAKTFDDPLTASGTLACGGGPVHVLIGFFNAGDRSTSGGRRTRSRSASRAAATGSSPTSSTRPSRWRAGGDRPAAVRPRARPEDRQARVRGLRGRAGRPRWSLALRPRTATTARGAITATHRRRDLRLPPRPGAQGRRGDLQPLRPAHRDEERRRRRGEVWLDDVTVDGEREDFDRDPGWEGCGNRRTYETTNVRPRFDFGYSPTHFAGGPGGGRAGRPGLPRRLPRAASRMACYGDRVGPLCARPAAAGVGQGRAPPGRQRQHDAVRLLPLRTSLAVEPVAGVRASPRASSASPSRARAARGSSSTRRTATAGDRQGYADGTGPAAASCPTASRTTGRWSTIPPAAGRPGADHAVVRRRRPSPRSPAGRPGRRRSFDRFGLVTTWIDGNGQSIYFDDLTYTVSQE